MLQHVVSLTPAVAGIVSVFVIWCSRFANLSHVAIPLHNGRIFKISMQKKTTDFFMVKRTPVVGKKVKVQQKLTKYFSMRPKVRRPGAAAPRHHHRRQHIHHHHPLPHSFSEALDHITVSIAPRAVALFPLGKARWYRTDGITPIRASIDFGAIDIMASM